MGRNRTWAFDDGEQNWRGDIIKMIGKAKEKSISGNLKLMKNNGVFYSVIALFFAMATSGIILAVCGYNPFTAYLAIFSGAFGSLRGIAQTLTQATPLIFTGMAFTLTKKTSLINLGVEGQMYFGALGSALIGIMDLGLPPFVHILLAILSGMIFGGVYGAVVGFLKVKFGSNEVVSGVMLNSIAIYFIGYLLNGPLLAEGSSVAQTERIVKTAQLPRVFAQYQVTIMFFISIIVCIFMKWFINQTTLGYEMRCVGINNKASETAGINIGFSLFFALCVSGAIAGLAGVNQVLGVDRRLINDFSPGYGFNGIAVSALAADNTIGVIFAGIIFGMLEAGAIEVNRSTGIPVEFVDVIQAMVIIFVSAPLLVNELFRIKHFLIGRKQVL